MKRKKAALRGGFCICVFFSEKQRLVFRLRPQRRNVTVPAPANSGFSGREVGSASRRQGSPQGVYERESPVLPTTSFRKHGANKSGASPTVGDSSASGCDSGTPAFCAGACGLRVPAAPSLDGNHCLRAVATRPGVCAPGPVCLLSAIENTCVACVLSAMKSLALCCFPSGADPGKSGPSVDRDRRLRKYTASPSVPSPPVAGPDAKSGGRGVERSFPGEKSCRSERTDGVETGPFGSVFRTDGKEGFLSSFCRKRSASVPNASRNEGVRVGQ